MAANTVLNYLPRKSVVHELTGTTKLAFFLLFTFAGMITYNTWVLLGLMVVSFAAFKLSHIKLREVRFMGIYGNTVVIEHGAGLKSIFYGLGALNVKAGENVKQGQLLGVCSKTVVAEMRIGTVPINPLLVWRGQCDGLKNY